MRQYFDTLEKEDNVSVLSPRGVNSSRTIEYGWVSNSGTATPGKDTRWGVKGRNTKLTADSPVTLIWNNGQGLTFERTISIDKDYMFKIEQRVINNSGKSAKLFPYALLAQRGIPQQYQGTWISYEGPIGFAEDELLNLGYDDLRKEKKVTRSDAKGWRYFHSGGLASSAFKRSSANKN